MGGRYLVKNNSWITSIIKGKPRRERPIQSYKKQIMLDLGKLSNKELKKVAMDRVEVEEHFIFEPYYRLKKRVNKIILNVVRLKIILLNTFFFC